MNNFIFNELKIDIDIDKIKKINRELLKKNLYKNLTKIQKYIIKQYKGPPHGIDKYGINGYNDLTDFFIDKQKFYDIKLSNIKFYGSLYGLTDKYYNFNIYYDNIDEKLKQIINHINKFRTKIIHKYIQQMDKIINYKIKNKYTIYRVMKTPFKNDEILNFTSWSLNPSLWFGINENIFHIYVLTLNKNIKCFYVEYDGLDKELFDIKDFPVYEYEFIIERNLKFKEHKSVTKKFKPVNFILKKQKNLNEQTCIIHYIKIIGKNDKKIEKYKNDIGSLSL